MRARTEQTLGPGAAVLPGYDVVRLLHHGRRVDTYDAYSHERDCRCVVKQVRPDRADELDVRQAVLLEGTLLQTMAHPHLVRCYEVAAEPLPSMVLETLPGATLAALIEQQRLETADVAMLGLQLCSVLGYLHRQDWLHLDVKPSNIVVVSGRATLIDLSLVGRPGSGRPGAGTRGYLAPEQARGTDLGAAADVWGLGVTLVEGLTGRLPFGDEATWDSEGRALPPGPPRRRLAAIRRRVPAELATLLEGCIALDPAERPGIAEARHVLRGLVEPG
jgi:eukaryotic-like serine/threonine-protein kinase